MSKEQNNEQLSALLDSALDEQQLQSFMQDLKRDPIADAEASQRYNLIGDVMRDELDQSSFMDISSAVHRAIEKEAPHNETPVVHRKEQGFNLASLFSSWVKPLTGMAVAASVAMVTLLTFNTIQSTDNAEQPAQLAQSTPIERVNIDISRNVQVTSTLDISKKSPEQQKQLNEYMLKHSGYASQSTMQGMMPYVRAADVKTHEKN
ncbi:MAG: sigma-E factor negative regulatory protein [Gammaproteobacteria bacterium]|nr:sigma-E factor negative regulatory protein [Gammaproteobacteria bacterium]